MPRRVAGSTCGSSIAACVTRTVSSKSTLLSATRSRSGPSRRSHALSAVHVPARATNVRAASRSRRPQNSPCARARRSRRDTCLARLSSNAASTVSASSWRRRIVSERASSSAASSPAPSRSASSARCAPRSGSPAWLAARAASISSAVGTVCCASSSSRAARIAVSGVTGSRASSASASVLPQPLGVQRGQLVAQHLAVQRDGRAAPRRRRRRSRSARAPPPAPRLEPGERGQLVDPQRLGQREQLDRRARARRERRHPLAHELAQRGADRAACG